MEGAEAVAARAAAAAAGPAAEAAARAQAVPSHLAQDPPSLSCRCRPHRRPFLTDPKLPGPPALERFRRGETLPSVRVRTPRVELPLGATEDRICGTIDIEKALTEGIKVHCGGRAGAGHAGLLLPPAAAADASTTE